VFSFKGLGKQIIDLLSGLFLTYFYIDNKLNKKKTSFMQFPAVGSLFL